jgi:hypothetical protein
MLITKLLGVAAFATGWAGIFHGMTGFTHPVCNVFTESFNMTGSFSGFPVTLPTIAFVIGLVCFMRESDAVFKL